jgi:hypothetical protein
VPPPSSAAVRIPPLYTRSSLELLARAS